MKKKKTTNGSRAEDCLAAARRNVISFDSLGTSAVDREGRN